MVQQYNLKGGFYFGTASKNIQDVKDSHSLLEKYFETIFNPQFVTIEPFSDEGIRGIILVITFKNEYLRDITTEHFVIRDYYFEPCKRLLFKLCYIDPSLEGKMETRFGDKMMASTSQFENEVKIQQHVFKSTNNHLQPITPLIYLHKIYDCVNSIDFLNVIYECCSAGAKERLTHISYYAQNFVINLGVILMEMRDGFSPVKNFPEINENQNFLAMTGEVLNRLHKTCGYTHGDLHQGNMLIETERRGYYNPILGNILLIDWGEAVQHFPLDGAQNEAIIPQNEAIIELRATQMRTGKKKIYWSYRWLDGPWNAPIPDISNKLRRLRRLTSSGNQLTELPAYFYQPAILRNWGVIWGGGNLKVFSFNFV